MPARSIVVRKFRSFAEADAADVEEDASRSIEEKLAAVEELRRRAYGEHYADVRMDRTAVRTGVRRRRRTRARALGV